MHMPQCRSRQGDAPIAAAVFCVSPCTVYFCPSFTVDCVLCLYCVFTARCTIMQSAIGVLRLHVVCPSVTLVDQDHVSWKSWKLIARTINPTSSLHLPGEHGESWGD